MTRSLLTVHSTAAESILFSHVQAAAAYVDRQFLAAWKQLRAIMAEEGNYRDAYRRALAVLRYLPWALSDAFERGYRHLYQAGHQLAARSVIGSLSVRGMQTLAARGQRPVTEDVGEEEPSYPDILNLFRLHKPTTRAGWADYIKALIFPPPDEETVWRALRPLVQPKDWQTLGPDNDKCLPEEVAAMLARGASQGRSQRDIAKDLLPFLAGSRTRAYRAARTFGLHIAHQGQEEAYGGLGEHNEGFTVHAVLDEHTRPFHRERDGTRYYRQPAPGQKGLYQCPHPPLEADDPGERPAGTSRIAWNCRCYLTVILSGLETLAA